MKCELIFYYGENLEKDGILQYLKNRTNYRIITNNSILNKFLEIKNKELEGSFSSQKRPTKKSFKILYIEDNELNFRLVYRYVSDLDADIELLHAPDGLSGVDLALTHLPDLILLDINLPKLHGFKVFEEIKKKENAKNIPIEL